MSNLFPARSLRRVVRASLALIFASFIGFVAPLSGFVRAQTIAPPVKGQYVSPPELSQAFVLSQTPDGDTICRAATPAEAREINRPSSVPLRQINHLKESPDQSFANGGVTTNATTTGLTIVLRGTAQLNDPANAAAKQAFINAAAKWEALIANPITVTIDVDFGTTAFGTPFPSSNILGSTSSSGFLIDYTTVRRQLVNSATLGTEEANIVNSLPPAAGGVPTDIGSITTILVPPSVMGAIGLTVPANATAPKIGFNSAFGFDFDPTDGVTQGQTDFDSVAVHEIGHALGFTSEAGARELDPNRALLATVWDLYRFKPSTASTSNFSTAQRVLTSGATSTDRRVQFNGNAEFDLSTGKPDGTGGDAQQSSHWKDDAQTGNFIGIMDPTIRRSTHLQISANDVRAIDFFGYSVGQFIPPTPPSNDNFASALSLTGTTGRVTGTNVGATKETGEPSHSPDGNLGGKSVWYAWQAPVSGTATFTTGTSTLGSASDFDTLLAVYTGSSVGALTPIIKNDDQATNNQTSIVTFNAVGGTTYMIAVDGFSADSGTVALSWNLDAAPVTGTTVQFASASTAASETSGSAQVTVTRSGIVNATSSVVVRTLDDTRAIRCDDTTTVPGVAFARCDYATTVQTITFAPNETIKTVTVPLIDDSFGEPNESVTLALSGVSGAILGAQSTTTLTITSNETPGQTGTNPILDPTFFVRMQYLDFLNREPDAGGMQAWVGTLQNCPAGNTTCDRASVSANFFRSQEFQLKGLFVFNFYKVALARLPLYAEIVADTSSLTDTTPAGVNAKKAAFTNAFVLRQDFLTQYAAMDQATFVNTLMNRYAIQSITTINPATPDDPAAKVILTRTDLVNRLNGVGGSLTRAQVLRAIANSDEVSAAEFNSAFVAMQYFGYLRRDPDTQGFNDWLRTINANPNDVHSMVSGFVNSVEYNLRFGPQ